MTSKIALITGVTGQDGSYLSELLLAKGYHVHGLVRRSSSFSTQRIEHLYLDPHDAAAESPKFALHYADLTDANVINSLVSRSNPDEVYNLPAQSHVRVSFDMPLHTADVTALGPIRLLCAVLEHQQRAGKQVRYYQASSSEMFGNARQVPQSELTRFQPRSPYAISKLFAHWATINYRESHDLHASCGILFNHESPRRGETFVTRKITRAVGRIKCGLQDRLYLGNLDARRDWGFAGDYVQAMWLMLQQPAPDDFVIATGRAYSIQDFCSRAFVCVGLDWRDHIEIDPRYFRPTEVDELIGDASKARQQLGWSPTVDLQDLVRMMVDSDLALARCEQSNSQGGNPD